MKYIFGINSAHFREVFLSVAKLTHCIITGDFCALMNDIYLLKKPEISKRGILPFRTQIIQKLHMFDL